MRYNLTSVQDGSTPTKISYVYQPATTKQSSAPPRLNNKFALRLRAFAFKTIASAQAEWQIIRQAYT
jgi:hypothetical protein